MAIDERAFKKISAADQAIVREVMEASYRNFDKANLDDNEGARDALINAGIESVPFEPAQHEAIRQVLERSNREIGKNGGFSPELYEEMLGYISEFRSQQAASATGYKSVAGAAEE